jgi:hypothetical protein
MLCGRITIDFPAYLQSIDPGKIDVKHKQLRLEERQQNQALHA